MLFINISSDQIHIADANKELFLHRNDIEHTLGPALIDWHKTSLFEKVFLLNGPGGFTNLRVGTLTLNLLNKLYNVSSFGKGGGTLQGGGFEIYSITKIDLFEKLYNIGILSSHGMIYIGQTKNVRHYDFKKMSYEKILLDKIDEYDDVFLDFVRGEYRTGKKGDMIDFSMKKDGLQVKYKEKKLILTPQELQLQAKSQIRPEYMIEAVN